MNLNNLKTLLSTNILAFSGWIIILYPLFIKLFCSELDGNIVGFLISPIYFSIYFLILIISIFVYIFEISKNIKLKNKFILENKIYNMFFIFGYIFSMLFIGLLLLAFIIYLMFGLYSLAKGVFDFLINAV